MSTLKERFAELSQEKPEITQADLARATGAKPPSVNDWFSGKTKTMKIGTATAAAMLYGVLPLWLAKGEGPKYPVLNDMQVLTEQFAVFLRLIPSEKRDAACFKAIQALTAFLPPSR